MRGNNRQQQADLEQAARYKLSDDISRAAANPSGERDCGWPPCIWECITVKYLHVAHRRVTLAKLGLMAGYNV